MKLTLEEARTWYQSTDAVHNFEHILRVYNMAVRLAKAEGADLDIVRAAALLHDAQGSDPGSASGRLEHHQASARFAAAVLAEKGWEQEKIEAVQHCILAHRFRNPAEKPETLEAKIIFDADKLDALGAIGVARVVAFAALVGTPFYEKPSDHFLKTGKEIEGEAHSAYHEHLFKLRKLRDRMHTPSAQAIADERLRYLDEFFERLISEWQGEK
ncbi:MAG: HD domain-containing protein [Anaerolineales bacterium]|uniref:HD domain-containing protein n=1 Tax=Candidatus Desulfolinea nitratireducens TaxID=2841698 RepID=A0A8J6NJ38_9CHLR|nr:HD domain-containing protein [Candidatus Desulfolinea nitratireducens]MBL6960453.1 HD domain-containing protein [Anaerolineales bacterium]